jgi:triphosphoribosyl-dephospho-CoA synthase
MRDAPRPHDLVRITPPGVQRISHGAPPWVEQSLCAVPWAVVRRARMPVGVAIGIRGPQREQRFATDADASEIAETVRPEALLDRSPQRSHRAFAALQEAARVARARDLRIGPIGAAGFEIATGVRTLHDRSDLDIVVRAHPSHRALHHFARELRGLPIRVDAELAFGDDCAVALEEALCSDGMLVKTPDGPRFACTSPADVAVRALIDEAEVTPKPALVDRRGSGVHGDLTLELLVRSANALRTTFEEIAAVSRNAAAGVQLRERLGAIGREGERRMLQATGGSNTHRGAIWSLGLLLAARVVADSCNAFEIAAVAAAIAALPDAAQTAIETNGSRARAAFHVGGAVAEAQRGFPHVVDVALPALRRARRKGVPEAVARVDALLAVMTTLDDTCLLHRGGMEALHVAQDGAARVLAAGGIAKPEGAAAFDVLERALMVRSASPGGAADMLAAALLLDSFENGEGCA